MKAYVLHNINDFRLERVSNPVPKEKEVLIKVEAAGICGSDIPRIYKTGAHTHPLILGHEFSGRVIEIGPKTEKTWKNKRVGIFPLIPCYQCIPCQRKQYEMCKEYSYLGSRQDGGFAEYVIVPENNLIELPENVSFEEAAMLEPMAVAVHAMRRISIHKKQTIVVCGLGTIGLLLLMFLKELGVEDVWAIGNKDFQKNCMVKMGLDATHYCDSRKYHVKQWMMERTGNQGVDIFFECVGKNETVMQAIDLVAPSGKIVLVGNPYSNMKLDQDLYWKILRNQLQIMGTWNSSFIHEKQDDWHYVLDRLKEKKISPTSLISHRFSFEEMEQGFHIMRDKTEDYVKIMGVFL